jgi:hypothetical protein
VRDPAGATVVYGSFVGAGAFGTRFTLGV